MDRRVFAGKIIICGGLAALLLLVGCAQQKADPTGIYLAIGGRAYIEIGRDASNKLMVKGTSLAAMPESRWQVSFEKGKLALWFETTWQTEGEWKPVGRYELLPSSTKSGDWNLVRYVPLGRSTGLREEEVPPLKQPEPSFLHRIDDRRVVEYFGSLAGSTGTVLPAPAPTPQVNIDRLAELASGLMESHPGDLYVRTLYLDALVRKEDSEALASRLAAWKESYEKTDDPSLSKVFRKANGALRAMQLSAAGRNAYDFIAKVLGRETDLASRFELFPGIFNYEEYAVPSRGLVDLAIANFLELQTSVKVFRVGAIFLMLEGKREEALKILTASYYLGQLLNQSDTIIGRLIGIAVRAISTGGLEIYALNCCETPEDFQNLWKSLEQLNRGSREPDANEIQSLFGPIAANLPETVMPNIKEAVVRHQVADAKFQLVRMATAAKYRFISEQAFPRSAEEFVPLLPDGPPKDPFAEEPLKFIAAPEKFTCYSIGADEEDNRATVSYDPTNGTVSRGDIFLEVPRKREYPFPRDGVKAASAEELRRQFPNGLPADPFADTRGKSLGISNTTPVYVYSYGPDVNEQWARQMGERYVPEVLYDPTNGTISQGDLFIAIPR
jgi:hypothetical protein